MENPTQLPVNAGTTYIQSLTEEQRHAFLQKAREIRAKKVEAGASLRQDWKDKGLWEWLRKKTNIRSVQGYIDCSETKYIRRTLKAVGKDSEWWKDNFCAKYEDFAKNNPRTPMYVLQGLILEAVYPHLVLEYSSRQQSNGGDEQA